MERVATQKPVNKTAALVVGKGFQYEPAKLVLTNDSALPLPTRPIDKQCRRNPAFTDLTGRKFGRFVVLGLSRDFNGSWVVRCNCGTYTTRKTKAITNPRNDVDRCEHCRHLAHLQNTEFYNRTGRDLPNRV